jgi:hypothetical protein
VLDADGEFVPSAIVVQLLAEKFFSSNENHLNREAFDRVYRPFDFRFGGMVSPHSVYRDSDHIVRFGAVHAGSVQTETPGPFTLTIRLLFSDFDHLAALVGAAGGTNAMGELLFATLRALGQSGGRQEVMRTALGGSAIGMPPFWIRHSSTFL